MKSKKITVIFLIVGKNGHYLDVKPDFEQGKFVLDDHRCSSNGGKYHLFGFSKSIQANEFRYLSSLNIGKTKDEVRLDTFRDLIDCLYKEAESLFDSYVSLVINVKQDQDAGTYWSLTADYQFLLDQC
ncbi:MAG: hypothetical protein WC264_02315 [Candidatus Paceibacterota bacterium]|jgi:hypothetical protein